MAALLEEDNKPDCPICGKYFAHDIFGGRCSRCSENRGIATAPSVWYSQEFQRQLSEYVDKHSIDESSHYYQVLKYHIQKNNLEIALEVCKEMKKENLWIKQDFALQLLRHIGIDHPKKSHLICSMIIDWWNMKKNDDWNGFELCYYGNFGEGGAAHVKSIPPCKLGWNSIKDVKKMWKKFDKHGG